MAAVKAAKFNKLPPLYTIKDIIKLYRLRAIKDLSQNFLLDSRITDKIVKAAGHIAGTEVCEVGPGPGSITRSILNRNPSKLIVIEKDRRFKVPLEMLEEAAPCQMDIIFGDVLTFNMEKTFKESNAKQWCENVPQIRVIGNLPFNVATPLIIKWLHAISEKRNAWKYGRVPLTLTFQKEVAERMAADVLSPQRSRLSIMTQNWCYVNHKFTIPGKAFVPKPDVDVGVVNLVPLVTPQIDLPFNVIEKVVRCVFHYRQKYCIRGIGTLFPKTSREKLSEEMCNSADINPMLRPYQLSIDEFGRLCHAYMDILAVQPTLIRYHRNMDSKEDEENDLDADVVDENDNMDISDNVLENSSDKVKNLDVKVTL